MKVVIIGSGNVGTAFAKRISGAGHEIIQIISRNVENARSLASHFNSEYTTNLFEVNRLADIYIICVADFAIYDVAFQLKLNKSLIVHTAASVSKDVLAGCSENYGVLYPLQTFRKEIASVPPIPVFVDASNPETEERLLSFASEWADTVSFATDEERIKLHLAAVFVNNFTNHLFAIAAKFCSDNGLEFNLLKRLIEETILRVEKIDPSAVQTGPAIRKDFGTIRKHQEMLENNPQVLELYNCLTNSIIAFYDRNKL